MEKDSEGHVVELIQPVVALALNSDLFLTSNTVWVAYKTLVHIIIQEK